MITHTKLLIIFLVLVMAFYLQQYRVLSFGGVNPNLILIGFALLIFGVANPKVLGILFLATVAMMLALTPYWSFQIVTVAVVSIGLYFLKRIFTGSRMLDFLIVVLLGTISFYVIVNIPQLSFLSIGLLLKEIMYNLILGSILWLVFL